MFDQLFAALSGDIPTEVRPLELRENALRALRFRLSSLGFNIFDLSGEIKACLRETQFRSLDSGRGLGFLTVMHKDPEVAQRRAEALLSACLKLGEELGGKRIVSIKTDEPLEGTQGRALQQALCDILSIASLPGEEEEFLRRLNRRVWRGLRLACKGEPALLAAVDENFAWYGEVPTAKTASIPVGAMYALWLRFLAVADATI